MVNTTKSYIFFALIFGAFFSFAQNRSFNYYHFGTEEGLSNSNILAIKQHPNGLMYMATQNGVYHYDGLNFIKLKTDSLKSNFIRNLNFDGNEITIITREDGIYKYVSQSKNVSEVKDLKFLTPKKEVIPTDELIVSEDFAYSLTDQNKLTVLNRKTGALTIEKANELRPALCLFKTKDGRILLGRLDGLYEMKGEKQEKLEAIKNQPVYSICENSEGKLVIGSNNKLFFVSDNKIEKEITPKFKAKAKTFLFDFGKNINKIIADKYGRIWFTASPDENIYLYENNNLYDIFELLNINPAIINCITKDKNENIWLGTFNDGVYFIQNPLFYNLSFSLNEKNLLVKSIFLQNNNAILATNNGLYGYNVQTPGAKATILSRPDDMFPEQIFNLAKQNTNLFYSKVSGQNNSVSIDKTKVTSIISKFIYPLNEKEGIITDFTASVLKIDLKTQKVLDTLVSFPDYQRRVTSMLIKDNVLFIGTSKGLTLVDLNTKAISKASEQVFNFPINDINLIDDKVFLGHEGGFSIYEDKKLVDKLGKLQLTAVKKVKFFNNMIWLATQDGLYCCDKQFNPVVVYNKASGLMSNSVNDIDFNDTKVCIATDKGISVSDIETIKLLRPKPEPIKLNYFEVDGFQNYNLSDKINLKASQDNFYIYFTSPLFTKQKQIFNYKIDKGEFTPFENSPVHFPSFPGGKHLLQIIASADGGINWSEPVVINIEKETKFSETSYMYIFITAGGLLLIIGVSYFVVKRVKKNALKRVKEEQQVNLLKHQSMNALLSPHFIFNSLTSIQNYINTNNSLMASEYLAKFSRLIRMIIEKAAQSHITLRDEITRLNYYLDLEKERFKNKFDFEIKVQEGLDLDGISIPNMIIQPHAENSIIHGILPKGEFGKLLVDFSKNNKNELIITIQDDGIGIIKAKENAKANHKSLGTSTIASILELNSKLYNKKQYVKMEDKSLLNPPSNGTIITITIEL